MDAKTAASFDKALKSGGALLAERKRLEAEARNSHRGAFVHSHTWDAEFVGDVWLLLECPPGIDVAYHLQWGPWQTGDTVRMGHKPLALVTGKARDSGEPSPFYAKTSVPVSSRFGHGPIPIDVEIVDVRFDWS